MYKITRICKYILVNVNFFLKKWRIFGQSGNVNKRRKTQKCKYKRCIKKIGAMSFLKIKLVGKMPNYWYRICVEN